MSDHFFAKDISAELSQLAKTVPTEYGAFLKFSQAAFVEGSLSVKMKELIALAVSLATKCPYCITSHSKKATTAGATAEEIAETVMATSAIMAWASITHSSMAIEASHNVD